MQTRWTLRQLFLWVFIAALIIPYLVAMVPTATNPLIELSIDDDIRTWLQDVDPSVQFIQSGGSSSSGFDSCEADHDYLFVMKNANTDEVFRYLIDRVREKISKEGWTIGELGSGSDSMTFVCSNGRSRCRLYIYRLPVSQIDQAVFPHQNKMRIKIISIGYKLGNSR